MGSSNEFRSITIPDLHFMHAIFFFFSQEFIRYLLKDSSVAKKYARSKLQGGCRMPFYSRIVTQS